MEENSKQNESATYLKVAKNDLKIDADQSSTVNNPF